MRRGLVALATTTLLAVAACSTADQRPAPQTDASSPATSAGTRSPQPAKRLPWKRPENQQARVEAAGLVLDDHESLDVHYHAHLDVFVNGVPVAVPAGLGINVGLNGTVPEHGARGIAPLHTHDTSGILHIEAPRPPTSPSVRSSNSGTSPSTAATSRGMARSGCTSTASPTPATPPALCSPHTKRSRSSRARETRRSRP